MCVSTSPSCSACGKGGDGGNNFRRCSGCKSTNYCNETCQRRHWARHRAECKRLTQLQDPISYRMRFYQIPQEGLFKLKVLTFEERRGKWEVDNTWTEEDARCCMDLYPRDFEEAETPRYLHEEYETIDEAVADGKDRSEMERCVPQWEERGHSSLEDACMKEHDARTPDEAIWDWAGIDRIEVLWPNEVLSLGVGSEEFFSEIKRRMARAGWRYDGWKPGRDFSVSESAMSYGRRTIGGAASGYAWSEEPVGGW